MEMNKNVKVSGEEIANKDISRREALTKAGYFAASAGGMLLLLGKPKKAMAALPAVPPAW